MKANVILLVSLAGCLLVPSASARKGESGGVPFSRPARSRAMPSPPPSRPAPRATPPDTTRRGFTRPGGVERQVSPQPRPAAPRMTAPAATTRRQISPLRPAGKTKPSSGSRPSLPERPTLTRPAPRPTPPTRTTPPKTFRPAHTGTGGGRFAPPPPDGRKAGKPHRPPPDFNGRRHHRHPPRPAIHPPYFATSRHHFFFNAWSWDPYGEAFVPVNLNPVFDPYWGWSGVGGIWWERAYATSHGYGLSRYGGYYPLYATGLRVQALQAGGIDEYVPNDPYTATVDPVTQAVVLPEPAQETILTPEQANDEMTDLLMPEYREDAFDDVYDALLLDAADTTLETRSWYTETLDPVRILRSYHGFDRENDHVNLFNDD